MEEEIKSYELIMKNQEEKAGLLQNTINQHKNAMEDLQHKVVNKEQEILDKQQEITKLENKVTELRKPIPSWKYLKETKITTWEQIYDCMKGFRPYLDYFYQIGSLKYNTHITINKLSKKIDGQVEIASQVMIMLNRLPLEKLEPTQQ